MRFWTVPGPGLPVTLASVGPGLCGMVELDPRPPGNTVVYMQRICQGIPPQRPLPGLEIGPPAFPGPPPGPPRPYFHGRRLHSQKPGLANYNNGFTPIPLRMVYSYPRPPLPPPTSHRV